MARSIARILAIVRRCALPSLVALVVAAGCSSDGNNPPSSATGAAGTNTPSATGSAVPADTIIPYARELRRRLDDAAQQGIVTSEQAELAFNFLRSDSLPYITGKVVSKGQDSFAVQTLIGSDRDDILAGVSFTFTLDASTEIVRGLSRSIVRRNSN